MNKPRNCYTIHSMNQASSLLRLDIREIHNAEFLKRLEWLVPWTELVALIELFYPEDENAHPPLAFKAMLHTHFLQLLFTMSGPAMAEAFLDVCSRRLNIDPPCRFNIDPGRVVAV